ncbi:hypothetical protein [Streptomyces sp. NPDC060198]|uniref:hypothetical protein n=1 Tax=Streptomyces sp. NPDC060198 TaxID=3347070 RepID=UPI003659A073
MTDRIGWAMSTAGVLVSFVLVSGAVQAYLNGDDSGGFVASAVLLQVATVRQLVRGVRRRRSGRIQAN